MGFVVGVRFVAKGGCGRVEGQHHPLGVQSLDIVEQGLEKAIGHAGGDTVFGAESPFASLGKGIETAKSQGMAIHQQQQGFVLLVGCCGHAPSYRHGCLPGPQGLPSDSACQSAWGG